MLVPSTGLICMVRDWPDDFGTCYIPATLTCVDNYGNQLVRWHFHQMNFASRYYFITESLDAQL